MNGSQIYHSILIHNNFIFLLGWASTNFFHFMDISKTSSYTRMAHTYIFLKKQMQLNNGYHYLMQSWSNSHTLLWTFKDLISIVINRTKHDPCFLAKQTMLTELHFCKFWQAPCKSPCLISICKDFLSCMFLIVHAIARWCHYAPKNMHIIICTSLLIIQIVMPGLFTESP